MSTDSIQNEAAEWLAREDRGLTAVEHAELAEWLALSTMHEVCFIRLQAAWERADRLAALNTPTLQSFAPPPRGSHRGRVVGAMAGAMILAVLVGYHYEHRDIQQSYATAVGNTQSLRLADGTRVELNSDTRLRTNISADVRSVTLDSGEAYFEVVHDASRPFVVYAGTKRITDLGTKFSVYRSGDDVRVIVKEGKVRVELVGAQAALTAQAGDILVSQGPESLISSKPEKEIVNDLSWRSGILVFDQQTLADAASEFNRYNAKQLVVGGSARNIKIGGRFKANNMASFVFLLHRGFGLTVVDRGTNVLVSR